jgi:hypothetical protein
MNTLRLTKSQNLDLQLQLAQARICIAQANQRAAEAEKKTAEVKLQVAAANMQVLQPGYEATGDISDSELTNSMIHALEKQRHEMKQLLLDVRHELQAANVPCKRKRDADVLQWYSADSWRSQQQVPWNEAEGRVMTPAEGVRWLVEQAPKKCRN